MIEERRRAPEDRNPPQIEREPRFSPRGRIGRLRLLFYGIWVPLLILLAGGLLAWVAALANQTLSGVVLAIAGVVATIATLIFYIKRCHDFDASGWWAIPAVIAMVANYAVPIVGTIAAFIVGLVYLLIPGTKGPNRFGPQPPDNTWVHWAFGLGLIPLVFFGGILAAIAIPAYHDYTARAQVGEAFVLSASAKTLVSEYYAEHLVWPDEVALVQMELGQTAGKYAALAEIEPDTGTISFEILPASAPAIAGRTVIFTPTSENSMITWVCQSPDIQQKYLPKSCSGL